LTGNRSNSLETDGDSWHISERRHGKFCRKVKLPFMVTEPATIQAKYDNGVLTVFIPEPENRSTTISLLLVPTWMKV